MSKEHVQPRVGVIGVGGIGRTHITSWIANGVTPVAVADTKPEVLSATAMELDASPFDSAEALIASGEIDIVSVCTPPSTHADLVISAIDAGLAVVCEKPLANSLDNAQRIADAVKRSGALVTVGFCHRFQPHIEMMKQMIGDGAIGEPMTFRNRFAGHKADAEKTWFANPAISGGGPMFDTSVHSVDLFRYLIGAPVHAAALTSTKETSLGPALDVEDTAVMLLQTADGTIGTIESSWRTPVGEWRVTVYGTGGTLDFDYSSFSLRYCPAGGEWQAIAVPESNRFERELAHFIKVWRGDGALRVTVEDGLAANRILDAAYRSAAAPIPIATNP